MRKTFTEIRKELPSYSETIKFDSSPEERQRFEIEELKPGDQFKKSLETKCQEKIDSTIQAARKQIDREVFKKLRDGIWEFRITYRGINYRFLAFWTKIEDRSFIIVTHGFVKKTRKVPRNELERAYYIRTHYLKKLIDNEKEK